MEGIVRKGELLFVPRGWWHLAINLEESVAITQNFVSSVNLPHVLKFLSKSPHKRFYQSTLKFQSSSLSVLSMRLVGETPDQVSGVDEDRRQHLYKDFMQALERSRPDLKVEEQQRKEGLEKEKQLAKLIQV